MCEDKNVKIIRQKLTIPTYEPQEPHELPMFFENRPYQGADGKVYPLPYSDGISDEIKNVDYDAYILENEYIKTVILPEIGGKILRGLDKTNNYDFMYYNEVVKPALVGLAGPWISGGIEFNWPQHHRPTTFMPLESAVEENTDEGKTVWIGEIDPLCRMKGMAGITLDKGRSYIKAMVRLYNRTDLPQVFMWWANLAVPVCSDYRTIFPPDVEWVNDHDRRAVLGWPIAKGVYDTARPFDFKDGTDISKYDAIKVPSSYLVSEGQSEMDFVAGYDEGKNTGIVTISDHHIAPGKKMWHWGTGDFGDMWCSNLTDKNGPYIELMTGVYTDNQPDFTWIAPYEAEEFCQFWYPIKDIGGVKNATADAAVNLEKTDRGVFIGINVTGVFSGAELKVSCGDKILLLETADLDPAAAYLKNLPLKGAAFNDIKLTLTSKEGRRLVEYKPYIRGSKTPIDVRKPVKRPSEIETVEELYINGLHLEQYKQHNYSPVPYYLEGIRRDPKDIRCNTSMARIALKEGRFSECIKYCNAALVRLTSRNGHPIDTEAFYLKGIALKYLEKYDEAYDIFYKAAWSYNYKSAAYYELALIDLRNGEYREAIKKLEISAGLNKGHLKAQNMLTAAFRKLNDKKAEKLAKDNTAFDRLDIFALLELSHFEDVSQEIAEFAKKPENLLNAARDYISAGLYDDAIYTLNFGDGYPLIEYYRAFILRKMGKDALETVKKAESMPTGRCFPADLQDIAVLKHAEKIYNHSANASYYLGCLYYDRRRYDKAIERFERCVEIDPKHGKAWRNLAIGYFDKKGVRTKAQRCMENAMRLRPDDPRILYEYQQLLKNLNVDPKTRLEIYGRHSELLHARDDCILDYITLLAMNGEYKEGIEIAKKRHFHIYEGGEGRLTKLHAWLHVLYGNSLLNRGLAGNAEQAYIDGLFMPASYGEAKTYFNQEAHIYYYLGRLFEKSGKIQNAEEYYKKGAEYKAAVSEISLFRALCLIRLGDQKMAQAVLDEMVKSADKTILNKELRSYYGVGSPTPAPFEYDIEKENLRDGNILKAFALLGLRKYGEAKDAADKARALDRYDFRIYIFDSVFEDLKENTN